jgi:hypothetical protein
LFRPSVKGAGYAVSALINVSVAVVTLITVDTNRAGVDDERNFKGCTSVEESINSYYIGLKSCLRIAVRGVSPNVSKTNDCGRPDALKGLEGLKWKTKIEFDRLGDGTQAAGSGSWCHVYVASHQQLDDAVTEVSSRTDDQHRHE